MVLLLNSVSCIFPDSFYVQALSVKLFINPQSFYTVSILCDVNEALSAVSSRPKDFHIAIVEVMNFHFLYK